MCSKPFHIKLRRVGFTRAAREAPIKHSQHDRISSTTRSPDRKANRRNRSSVRRNSKPATRNCFCHFFHFLPPFFRRFFTFYAPFFTFFRLFSLCRASPAACIPFERGVNRPPKLTPCAALCHPVPGSATCSAVKIRIRD